MCHRRQQEKRTLTKLFTVTNLCFFAHQVVGDDALQTPASTERRGHSRNSSKRSTVGGVSAGGWRGRGRRRESAKVCLRTGHTSGGGGGGGGVGVSVSPPPIWTLGAVRGRRPPPTTTSATPPIHTPKKAPAPTHPSGGPVCPHTPPYSPYYSS